jgi:hypothetical protein
MRLCAAVLCHVVPSRLSMSLLVRYCPPLSAPVHSGRASVVGTGANWSLFRPCWTVIAGAGLRRLKISTCSGLSLWAAVRNTSATPTVSLDRAPVGHPFFGEVLASGCQLVEDR